MNALDAIIIVGMILIFAAVFFAGLSRALAVLVALWAGLVGADIFGLAVGDIVYDITPGIETWTADLIGFVLALAVVTAATLYLLVRSFRTMSARARYRFDIKGGVPALALTIILAGVVALSMITVFVQITDRTVNEVPEAEASEFVVDQFRNAALRPATQEIAAYVYNVTGSWVPGGAPSLLAPEN